VPGSLHTAALQLKTAQRVVRTGGGSLRERFGAADDRLVFVLGCPRSGTTFLGRSLGALPGFVDLGEVKALKAAIPEFAAQPPETAAPRIRALLTATRRLSMVGSRRAVEQTPETAFVGEGVARAFPAATILHIVRDGRDVVCSLLERGWLSAGREGADDAGLPYGAEARFWVEPGREAEFRSASDARRAAWAWRRYVGAARGLGERAVELRYERLSSDPDGVADDLAERLGIDAAPLAERLLRAHGTSVGRFRTELSADQLADVEAEAGPLLRELGYA
jgi:hypothetical protein